MSIQDVDNDTLLPPDSHRALLSSNIIVRQSDEIVVINEGVTKICGTTWYASVFIVVNAALGAAVLNFPAAYHEAGGVAAVISIQVVILLFVVATLLILAYCSDFQKTDTFQDAIFSVCGQTWKLICALALVLYCYGICLTFLIVIADQWEIVVLYSNHHDYCLYHPWYMSRPFTLCLTSVVFILPMCFSEKIDFLKYASSIGVLGILYVTGLIIAKYFLPHPTPRGIRTAPTSLVDMFLAVPTICFAYLCHVSIVPVYACLQTRTVKELSKTVGVSMVICAVCYTASAALGYLTFGEDITTDILLSYDPCIEVIIAVVLFAIKMYTTYPILLFCGRAALDSIWVYFRRMSKAEALSTAKMRRIVMTLVWFITTLVLGAFIPNIGVVISFLGCLAALFIFVFPGWCLVRLVYNRALSHYTFKDVLMVFTGCAFVTIGVFVAGVTFTQNVMDDVQPGHIHADKSRYTC